MMFLKQHDSQKDREKNCPWCLIQFTETCLFLEQEHYISFENKFAQPDPDIPTYFQSG